MLSNRNEKYPNVDSRKIAGQVIDALKSHGIDTLPVQRGLDYGVWASFKVAFEPEENPLNVPIVQVSLFFSEDPSQQYKLGRAVASLRSQGMAVHNLRHLRFATSDPTPMPYTSSFEEALNDAATGPPTKREQRLVTFLEREDARLAHPTFEHLLPINVEAGAANEDVKKRLWTLMEVSESWTQYSFGEIEAS